MEFLIYILLLGLLSSCQGFYVPGVAPVEFKIGSQVEIKAVKMTSSLTQLPYDYYTLPFCRPPQGTVYKTENLGEILRGDRIVNTAYNIEMNVNNTCSVVCNNKETPNVWSDEESDDAINKINREYYIHFILDNLPAATKFQHLETKESVYERGFRLGYVSKDNTPILYNHLNFILSYHTDDNEKYRIVGFEVDPQSIALEDIQVTNGKCSIPKNFNKQELKLKG